MFRYMLLVGCLLFLLQSRPASAGNTVIWKNHCEYDLYFWVISPGSLEHDDAFTRVPARGEFVHAMAWHPQGGVSLKYRDVPYYTKAPAGILQAEYALDRDQGRIFYDSSIIDCGKDLGPQNPYYCPFAHGGVKMSIVGDRGHGFPCRDSYCRLGGQCDESTYLIPGGWNGEPTLSCPIGVDLVFETCVESSAERTWKEGQVSPLPAPWQPPPPLPPPPPPPPPPPSEPLPPPPVSVTWSSVHTPPATSTQSTTVLKGFATVTKEVPATVTAQPTRTGRPKTYPVPDGFPETTVCFDAECRCYGIWGQGEAGRADCGGLDGIVECYFFNVCEKWHRSEGGGW